VPATMQTEPRPYLTSPLMTLPLAADISVSSAPDTSHTAAAADSKHQAHNPGKTAAQHHNCQLIQQYIQQPVIVSLHSCWLLCIAWNALHGAQRAAELTASALNVESHCVLWALKYSPHALLSTQRQHQASPLVFW
jgi:hypothetical protein